MNRIILEALIVGISTVVMGTVVAGIVGKWLGVDLPPVCKDWNKNYSMEISLFLTGFLLHLFFEFTKINKWYCTNGYACKN